MTSKTPTTKPKTPRPRLLSIPETADRLGICEKTLRRQIAAGAIPVVRIGRRVLIDPTDLERGVSLWKTRPVAPRFANQNQEDTK